MSLWYLYLIECADGSYYAGIATDVERRFAEHQSGKGARYTRSHRPLRVLASCVCGSRSEALKAELALKKLPRDKKLAALLQQRLLAAGSAGSPVPPPVRCKTEPIAGDSVRPCDCRLSGAPFSDTG